MLRFYSSGKHPHGSKLLGRNFLSETLFLAKELLGNECYSNCIEGGHRKAFFFCFRHFYGTGDKVDIYLRHLVCKKEALGWKLYHSQGRVKYFDYYY